MALTSRLSLAGVTPNCWIDDGSGRPIDATRCPGDRPQARRQSGWARLDPFLRSQQTGDQRMKIELTGANFLSLQELGELAARLDFLDEKTIKTIDRSRGRSRRRRPASPTTGAGSRPSARPTGAGSWPSRPRRRSAPSGRTPSRSPRVPTSRLGSAISSVRHLHNSGNFASFPRRSVAQRSCNLHANAIGGDA